MFFFGPDLMFPLNEPQIVGICSLFTTANTVSHRQNIQATFIVTHSGDCEVRLLRGTLSLFR